MSYRKRAHEMYTTLETAMVNCCLPSKYKVRDVGIYEQVYEQLVMGGFLIVESDTGFQNEVESSELYQHENKK